MPNNNGFRSLPPLRTSRPGAIRGSRVATRNIIGREAISKRSRFCCRLTPPVFVVSPDCQRRNRQAERKDRGKTNMAASKAPVNPFGGRNRQELLPKSPKNSSRRALRPAPCSLRLVRRTFQHERRPDSHTAITTHTEAANQGQPACHTNDRPPQSRQVHAAGRSPARDVKGHPTRLLSLATTGSRSGSTTIVSCYWRKRRGTPWPNALHRKPPPPNTKITAFPPGHR
jgi:hypothetical protein